MTTRESIIETINKLFIYTDSQNWEKLQLEVFAEKVFFDMSSMSGVAMDTNSKEICKMWREGFNDLDAVYHLGGNYLVEIISQKEARAFAYATATHFKESAKNGKIREFAGTYDFKLFLSSNGWRIHSFVYNMKFTNGNVDLN